MNTDSERGNGGGIPTTPPSAIAILVVEDNETDAALLTLMFRRSRILNPLQMVNSVGDATRYLSGEGAFADRKTSKTKITANLPAKIEVEAKS